MSHTCNGMIEIDDPVLEALKNKEIELGSAAYFRAFGSAMYLLAAAEVREVGSFASKAEEILRHLTEAKLHYDRVLEIVEAHPVAPRYVEWLKNLKFNALHEERVSERMLFDEAKFWNLVVEPLRSSADPVKSFKDGFLNQFEELHAHVQYLANALPLENPEQVPTNVVPVALWPLSTLFCETLVGGQAIAVINVIRPGEKTWSELTATTS